MKKTVIITAVLCIMTVLLAGCKDTAVLKKIIYADNQPVISTEQQEIDNSSDEAKEDPKLEAENSNPKSENMKDGNSKAHVKGKDKNDKDPLKVAHDETSSRDLNNASAMEKDNTTAENGSSRENRNDSTRSGSTKGNDKDSKKGDDDSDESKGDDSGSKLVPSDEGTQTIVDANGVKIKVPENVETVTATGEIAPMVEMLGGTGRLLGSSESFTENSLTGQVFTDAGKVGTWWSGTGKDGIMNASFRKLLNAKPDVCLMQSGEECFTDSQIKTLSSNGITCFSLYAMNTPENIEKNATLLGKILGSKSGEGEKDAPAMARKYNRWCEKTMSAFADTHFTDYTLRKYLAGKETSWGSVGSGCYTLLVQHWDDSAQVKVYSNRDHGLMETWQEGAAAADSGFQNSPVSYFMSIAGVVNTAAAEAAVEKNIESYTWYVNQWVNGACYVTIDGAYTSYKTSGDYNGPLLFQLAKDPILTDMTAHLGTKEFNKIIACNREIADEMENTRLASTKGLGTEGNRYIYNVNSRMSMYSSVESAQQYSIEVNPYGVGCWYEGSAESFLETYWIAGEFGTVSGYDSSDVSEVIKEFYQTFYGYSLSDSQLNGILKGSYVPSFRAE